MEFSYQCVPQILTALVGLCVLPKMVLCMIVFKINSKILISYIVQFPQLFFFTNEVTLHFCVEIQHTLSSRFFFLFSLSLIFSLLQFHSLIYSWQYCHLDVKMHWVDLLSGEPVKVSPAPEGFNHELKQVNKARVLPVCQPVLWFTHGVHMYTWCSVRKQLLSTVSFWKFSVFQCNELSAAKVDFRVNQNWRIWERCFFFFKPFYALIFSPLTLAFSPS